MVNWKYLDGQLYIGGQKLEPTSIRTLEEMRPVLAEPSDKGPEVCYWVYRDIDDPDKPEGTRADLTVIAAGKIGEEFVKTHGHYHIGEGSETYQLLSGEAMMVIQKPSFNFEGVEAVRLVKLPLNQKIDVPSGWGHNLVNTGTAPLVAINYLDPSIENLYSAYEKKRGAAYYVFATDRKISLEPNKNYGDVPKLQTF